MVWQHWVALAVLLYSLVSLAVAWTLVEDDQTPRWWPLQGFLWFFFVLWVIWVWGSGVAARWGAEEQPEE